MWGSFRRWYADTFALDLRALACMRIAFGGFILWDVTMRLQHSIHWYTSDLPESITHVRDTPHGAPIHQFLFQRGSQEFQQLSFLVQVVVTGLFMIGFQTQLFNVAAWVALVVMHGKQESINDASDRFLRNLLLYSCFVPMGEYYSVDSWLNTRKKKFATFVGVGTCCIITQIIILYHAVIAQRWRGNSKEWFPSEGTAMYYIMSGSLHTTSLAKFLSSFPDMMYILTMKAMIVEILLPLMLLFTSTHGRGVGRLFIACSLMAFHIGIRLTLVLTNFTLVNFISVLALLPTKTFGHPISYQKRTEQISRSFSSSSTLRLQPNSKPGLRRRRIEQEIETKSILEIKEENMKSEKVKEVLKGERLYSSFRATLAGRSIGWFLFGYMLYHFMVADVGILPSFDHGDIGHGMRTYQDWRMFRGVYQGGFWVTLTAHVRPMVETIKREEESLEIVYDLLKGWTEGNWSAISRSDLEALQQMPWIDHNRYPSWRLHRWFFKLLEKSEFDRTRKIETLGMHLCSRLNSKQNTDFCNNDVVVLFKMYVYKTNPPKTSEHYTKPLESIRHETICPCYQH